MTVQLLIQSSFIHSLVPSFTRCVIVHCYAIHYSLFPRVFVMCCPLDLVFQFYRSILYRIFFFLFFFSSLFASILEIFLRSLTNYYYYYYSKIFSMILNKLNKLLLLVFVLLLFEDKIAFLKIQLVVPGAELWSMRSRQWFNRFESRKGIRISTSIPRDDAIVSLVGRKKERKQPKPVLPDGSHTSTGDFAPKICTELEKHR